MQSFVLVIFGVTSNLAKIKLIPALYDLAAAGVLPEKPTVLGIARSPMTKSQIEDYARQVINTKSRHHNHEIDQSLTDKIASRFYYLDGHLDDPEFYPRLQKYLEHLTQTGQDCNNRIYYLATYPDLYATIFNHLEKSGLNDQKCGWVRLMIEKPIGHDLKSAQALNHLLGNYYKEDQIYRLDHYLGKETMQNILAFRFANSLFEPLINHNYIDHIQVTAAEDFGIGDRGGYYDRVGALKDVGQNHLLQMLVFATMDAPAEWSNAAITQKRIELLQQLQPDPTRIVFGQYAGYRSEPNVSPDSTTDTFFAFKATLTNPRLEGIPVYFRGGKKLKQTVTEVSIVFKPNPHQLLEHLSTGNTPNALIYRIQPNEGIVLKVLTKKAQHQLALEETFMQYCYYDYSPQLPDPYERLIHDAFHGDQTFFVDAPEIEAQWSITDQLSQKRETPLPYRQGSWGPSAADDIIKVDGRQWLTPSLAFCAR